MSNEEEVVPTKAVWLALCHIIMLHFDNSPLPRLAGD
jgi:hypothetical protein